MDCTYAEIDAKSLLRDNVLVDPWFLGSFGLNLYRGCAHGCVYCDGRAERYYVEGDFERDIVVKRNAVELVEREFSKIREPGFVFLGGGVSDSYQAAEAKYRLARGILELIHRQQQSCHVLTKSALVERDFDILLDIARERRALLSVSLQTVDDAIRQKLEPHAASVSERLRLLGKARALGISGGIMAMPVLPGLSDSATQIDDLVKAAADAGAQYVCFGALTLRPGRQKNLYYDALRHDWPALVPGYDRAYGRELTSGAPDPRFVQKITERYSEALQKQGLPARIPRAVFHGYVPCYTEASVLLEHLETEAKLEGRTLNLARSGYALATWARKRLVALARKRGFSYRDVEAEFLARLAEGSLGTIEGVSGAAAAQLRQLGFG